MTEPKDAAPAQLAIENHGTPHWSSGSAPESAEAWLAQWTKKHFVRLFTREAEVGYGWVLKILKAFEAHRHAALVAERDLAIKDTAILLERVRGLTEALEAAERDLREARADALKAAQGWAVEVLRAEKLEKDLKRQSQRAEQLEIGWKKDLKEWAAPRRLQGGEGK